MCNGERSFGSGGPYALSGKGRVHQEPVLLDDGREVLRYGISSDGLLAAFIIAPLPDSDEEDLEGSNGTWAPRQICFEVVLLTEVLPASPGSGSVSLGGRNMRLKFPRLCNAEITEESISGRLWQIVQARSCG